MYPINLFYILSLVFNNNCFTISVQNIFKKKQYWPNWVNQNQSCKMRLRAWPVITWKDCDNKRKISLNSALFCKFNISWMQPFSLNIFHTLLHEIYSVTSNFLKGLWQTNATSTINDISSSVPYYYVNKADNRSTHLYF